MATEPAGSELIQFHSVFRRNSRSRGGIRFRVIGFCFSRFCLGRSFSRSGCFSRGCRAFFLDHRRLDEAEPDKQRGDSKDHDNRDDARQADLLVFADLLQEDQHDDRQDDRIEQRDESVPVRRVVRFDLNGCGVRLRVQDVMAGFAHCVACRVVVGFNAGAHQAEHHIVACADSKVRIHPGGIRHCGVGNDHSDKAPFIPEHVGQQCFASACPCRP